jgi:hypothetical protein
LWAAIRFVRDGRRRDALWLALAAGVGLYAYPPLKLAVPLLMALALALALRRHGRGSLARWWPAALVLSLLWAPFAASTLLNSSSGARLQLIAIKAGSAGEWLAIWWSNYSVYFQPNLYYLSGGVRKIVQGMPDRGVALGAEAPLLLGLLGLPLLARTQRSRSDASPAGVREGPKLAPLPIWLLLAGALLIAPLPASLTVGHPHTFRASMVAPIYAVLVGIGAAVESHLLGRLSARVRAPARLTAALVVAAMMAWQSAGWFASLIERYPSQATNTWFFADGEVETMRRVVGYAPGFDEVWFDIGTVGRPYIFLLLVQPLPPADVQARLVVERNPPEINNVTGIGQYRFVDFAPRGVPLELPVLEALPTSGAGPGYLLQEWRPDNRRILLVRSMTTHVPDDRLGDEANT